MLHSLAGQGTAKIVIWGIIWHIFLRGIWHIRANFNRCLSLG